MAPVDPTAPRETRMPAIAWHPDLATGDERVDTARIRLFTLFRELAAARQRGAGRLESVDRVFDVLRCVTLLLADEEHLLERTAWPACARHRSDHAEFLGRLNVALREYLAGNAATIEPLHLVIRGWLVDHVDTDDRRCARHTRDAVRHA